jgi:multiple sugar transport system permease protein
MKISTISFARKEKIYGSMLILPSILVLFFTSVIPLGYSLYISFTNLNFSLGKSYKFVGASNYVNAFKDELFIKSFFITILFVVVTVFFEVILGMAIALLFSREHRSFNLSRTLLLLPMVSTPIVIGILWRILLNSDYGLVNYLLSWFGISKVNWLGDPIMALIAVMAVDIWQWTPFIVLIVIAALLSVPQELMESARIDGAGHWLVFWKVKLPVIMPVFLIALLLRFIDAFKVVDTVYVMTYGGPGNATKVLSMFIYQTSLKYFKIGYGSAISILFIVFLIIISYPFIRQRLRENEVS